MPARASSWRTSAWPTPLAAHPALCVDAADRRRHREHDARARHDPRAGDRGDRGRRRARGRPPSPAARICRHRARWASATPPRPAPSRPPSPARRRRRSPGRGTGVDDAGRRRKVEAIRRALAVNQPDPADALDVLAKVGGFEIAGLVGVILAGRRLAAARRARRLHRRRRGAGGRPPQRRTRAARSSPRTARPSRATPRRSRLSVSTPTSTSACAWARGRAPRCASAWRARRSRADRHGDLQVRRGLGSPGRAGGAARDARLVAALAAGGPAAAPGGHRGSPSPTRPGGASFCPPRPPRIISLVPSVTETVFTIGCPGSADRRHRLLRLPAGGAAEAEHRRHGLAEPRGHRGPQARPRGRHARGQPT